MKHKINSSVSIRIDATETIPRITSAVTKPPMTDIVVNILIPHSKNVANKTSCGFYHVNYPCALCNRVPANM